MIQKSTIFQNYSILEINKPTESDMFQELNILTGIAESEPPSHVISNIMGFSNSYFPVSTQCGNIDLILN